MEPKTKKLVKKYLKLNYPNKTNIKQHENFDPPVNAPTEFWLSVLYYQKLFNSGYKVSMGNVSDFSHLSIHAEMELDEMVKLNKYPNEWFFWMFDEIGWFNPDCDE
jgi:hypothetical protein